MTNEINLHAEWLFSPLQHRGKLSEQARGKKKKKAACNPHYANGALLSTVPKQYILSKKGYPLFQVAVTKPYNSSLVMKKIRRKFIFQKKTASLDLLQDKFVLFYWVKNNLDAKLEW